MRTFRNLGIATIACLALSSAAWATSGNGNGGGNGNGNSGRGNDVLQSVINLPQITTPLIHRSGSQQLAPIVNHKMPSNSLTDGNRGIGLRGQDLNRGPKLDRDDRGPKFDRDDRGSKFDRDDRGSRFDRSDRLDNRKAVLKQDEKSEKAEKEAETRLAANTTDDASGSRKTEFNRPEPSCR